MRELQWQQYRQTRFEIFCRISSTIRNLAGLQPLSEVISLDFLMSHWLGLFKPDPELASLGELLEKEKLSSDALTTWLKVLSMMMTLNEDGWNTLRMLELCITRICYHPNFYCNTHGCLAWDFFNPMCITNSYYRLEGSCFRALRNIISTYISIKEYI